MEDRQAICVLVVEDDPEDAMILRRHLGSVATFCVSVERILDWEGSKGADNFQRYDVIFLDYRLSGGVTGLDALREIREKDSYFPVIILTGSGDEEIAVEIMKAGATDYIVKESLSPQLLGKALSHALDARATAQEKARLDDALRQSEERYRTLVNSVTEYLYSVKVEDGRAVPVLHSQSCSQITGYSPGDYENNPGLWLEMVLPEDRPRVMEHFRRLMRGEAVEPIEHRIIHKDAEVRWVRNSAVPRFDEKGELTGYDGLVADITDRKQAEEETAAKNEQLENANRRLAELAQIDELTGLANRRSFFDVLSSEVERFRRYNSHLSIVMCDIDHFKQVNDACGHAFGDTVLREVASMLKAGCRNVDTVARYGGEEFMVIMPDTTSEAARHVAERLREALAERTFADAEHQVKVTVSFGVAGAEAGRGGSVDDLVNLADEALYAAKRSGRNCVVNWRDVTAGAPAALEDSAEQVQALQKRLASLSLKSREVLLQSIMGLAQAQEARDPYLAGHSRNVTTYAVAIGRQLGWNADRLEAIRRAAMLHDIGKIGIPDRILQKPGPLDKNERAVIQQHPLISVQILETMGFLTPLLSFIRHHHERWDGEGYPDGLGGTAIPLEARVLAVADTFDAIASDRPYHKRLAAPEAYEIMFGVCGKQLDAEMVKLFVQWHKDFADQEQLQPLVANRTS